MRTTFIKGFVVALLLSVQALAVPYIRFWRGVKKDTVDAKAFVFDLGQNFLPSTISMGKGKGLIAYLPVLLPVEKHKWPGEVPEEIALVVYENEEKYKALRASPIGTAYAESHWNYFVKETSSSLVPEEMPAEFEIKFDHAYRVTGKADDWQKYPVTVAVDTRPKDASDDFYLGGVRLHLTLLRENPVKDEIRSILALVDENYTILYYQWENAAAAKKYLAKPAERWAIPLKEVKEGPVRWDWGQGVNFKF